MSRQLDSQVTKRARALIHKQEQWRRMVYAMDAKGERVDWCSEQASTFCAIGALRRAAFDLSGDRQHAIMVTNKIACKMTGIAHEDLAVIKMKYINDAKGHAAVLQLFDTAIRQS